MSFLSGKSLKKDFFSRLMTFHAFKKRNGMFFKTLPTKQIRLQGILFVTANILIAKKLKRLGL